MISYTQRQTPFAGPCTSQLHEKGLIPSEEAGQQITITFTNVTSAKLRFEPTRVETRRYAMLITAGRDYTLTDINYRGIMDFEAQSDAYNIFIDAFHNRLAAANPDVSYSAGSTPAAFAGNVIASRIVVALLIGIGIFLLTSALYAIVAIKLLLLAFYVPVMLLRLK